MPEEVEDLVVLRLQPSKPLQYGLIPRRPVEHFLTTQCGDQMLGRGRKAGLDPLHRDEVIPDHVRNCRLIAVPEQFGQNVVEGPQLRDEVVLCPLRTGPFEAGVFG